MFLYLPLFDLQIRLQYANLALSLFEIQKVFFK